MNSEIIEFYLHSTISISCLYLLIITLYKFLRAKAWGKLTAEIVEFNLVNETEGHYLYFGKEKNIKSLTIQYNYMVSNKEYEGTKVSLIDDLPILSNYDDTIHSYINTITKNNEKIEIYVDPKNNKNSLINRKLNHTKAFILLSISFFFILLSFNLIKEVNTFTLYSYLTFLILLIPIVAIEHLAFKKNQSKEIGANK